MANQETYRIYKVNTPDGSFSLVEARNASAAIKHVVGSFFKAELAKQRELVEAVKAGVQIEVAGANAGQEDIED